MAAQSPVARALLVGIDEYPSHNSLKGCVRDIMETATVLKKFRNITEDNIRKLIAPRKDSEDPDAVDPNSVGPDDRPSGTNFLNAIRLIGDISSRGDFVYIHYSGHGGRRPNPSPWTKAERPFIETITTLDDVIEDWRFGKELNSLTDKGLNVLVVLDCCHSGGATREDDSLEGVRCSGDEPIEDKPVEDGPGIPGIPDTEGSGDRNAVAPGAWFDKKNSKYDLIAACQADEKARERKIKAKGGLMRGLLTYYFLEQLELHRTSQSVDYNHLIRTLKTNMEDPCWDLREPQQPIHLGDGTRFVLGTGQSNNVAFSLSTNVVSVGPSPFGGRIVNLAAGQASGISIGDRFIIHNPSHSAIGETDIHAGLNPVIEVQVDETEDLTSTARLRRGSLDNVQNGWLARLSRRAHVSTVNVKLFGQANEEKIKANILKADVNVGNKLARLDWIFDSDEKDTVSNFSVSVKEGMFQAQMFQVQDRQYHVLSPLPAIKANGDSDAEALVRLIQQLSMYRAVSDLRPTTDREPPEFGFEKLQIEVSKQPELKGIPHIKSAWKFTFENKTDDAVFISILNLNPVYGISQVYPYRDAEAEKVEGRRTIVIKPIGIQVPKLFRNAEKGSQKMMKDVFKLFITKKPVSFSHYIMPDLEDAESLEDAERNAVVILPQTAPWHVHDITIETSL